jgi:hypothetical protein
VLKTLWKVSAKVGGFFCMYSQRKADLGNFNKLWQNAHTGIVSEDYSQIACSFEASVLRAAENYFLKSEPDKSGARAEQSKD